MTPLNIQRVPAGELKVGDRIAEGFLPGGESGEVLFTRAYTAHGHDWVIVVVLVEGCPEAEYWLADALVPAMRAEP